MTAILAKKVNNALSDINELFPDINHGGCGVFACYFAEKMISFGFDAKIIELSSHDWFSESTSKDEFLENNKNMHKAKEKHKSPNELGVHADSHYCIEIDYYYFDSCVYRKKSGDKLQMYDGCTYSVVGEVSLPDMEYISIEDRGHDIWNDMYDESDNEGIKKFIDKALSFLTPKKQTHAK